MHKITKFIPLINWISTYNKNKLASDSIAGLTVGVMLIPQGMAYALLAGLPPVFGLYAALIPQIIYAIFGTSRQLSVGPVAMDSLLVATIVSAMTSDIDRIIDLAILLALMMGTVQFIFGVLKFGFLVNFLSKPVISAFTFGAALIIGLSQVKHLVGISLDKGISSSTVQYLLTQIIKHLSEISTITLLIGFFGIIFLLFLKYLNKKIPGALVLVILGIALVYLFNLDMLGVKIVGFIPGGLPEVKVPSFSPGDFIALIPASFTLALIAFMEAISVSKTLELKHDDYKVDPNQELIALGASNIVGSFFSSYSVTGGFSRSAVNDEAGAKTGMSSIISSLLILFTLLFLTDFFYYLPNAILGSIIIVAIFGLIDLKVPISLWKSDKIEFSIFLITFLSTLLIGIQEGIGIGVLLSLLVIIYNVSYPHIAVVGKIKGTSEYRNIERYKNLEIDNQFIMIRLDARLFYANMNFFRDRVNDLVEGNENKTKAVIIIGKAINGIDSSSIDMLKILIENLNKRGVDVLFTGLKGPIKDKIRMSGVLTELLKHKTFMSIDDALNYYRLVNK